MDDLDIYEDLDEFDLSEQLRLKVEEVKLLDGKYRSALKQIEELKSDRQNLQKKIENIEKSFSSLLTTARVEITRKTTQITDLRKELDDICFRRGIRGRAGERPKTQHVSEGRCEPHGSRHSHEKESNSDERNSNHSRNKDEKSRHPLKPSERELPRSHNLPREREDKRSKYQSPSWNIHSTTKQNESRHRDHILMRKEEVSIDHRREEKSKDHRREETSVDRRKREISNDRRREEKSNNHKREGNSVDRRKREISNDRRKEEKSNDHKKEDKSIDRRKEDISTDRIRGEKSNDNKKDEKSHDHRKEDNLNGRRREEKNANNDSRNSRHKNVEKEKNVLLETPKSEREAVYKAKEKHSMSKIKTYSLIENKSSPHISLPELNLNQAAIEIAKKDKVQNEFIAEKTQTIVERRITLIAYRNRLNTKCLESVENGNPSESDGIRNIGDADSSSVTVKQNEVVISANKTQSHENKSKQISSEKSTHNLQSENALGKNKSMRDVKTPGKRTFEDVLFDELVFEESEKTDKREECGGISSDESEEGCLYASLEVENISKEANSDQGNSNNYKCDSTQNKVQKEEIGNEHGARSPKENTEKNKIETVINEMQRYADTSKSKTVSYLDPPISPTFSKEVENSKAELCVPMQIDPVSLLLTSEENKLKTSKSDTRLDVFLPQINDVTHSEESKNEHGKEDKSEGQLENLKTHKESDSQKFEGNVSYSNIFDSSFESENNKPKGCMSPYFGDQKTPAKHDKISQSPRQHSNSVENQLEAMFKDSPEASCHALSTHKSTTPIQASSTPETNKNVQKKAKEMFDLYLASPTNVIPSEIEKSKERSPPNSAITGMKKRKSSTPRKSPGLLNGRGLKLVGHRIEGFEPGIRGEKALEASKLKNALFKEILGNESIAESAMFRCTFQENSDENDFQLNTELELPEENRSQILEGTSKARRESINDNRDPKKVVRFVSAELLRQKETTAGSVSDDSKVLNALECLENISDEDFFSDTSSGFNGKQSKKDPVVDAHQGEQTIEESRNSNEAKVTNEIPTNDAEEVKTEESKDLDDDEISPTEEPLQTAPSKEENESCNVPTEEGDEEVIRSPSQSLNNFGRISSTPLDDDKICVIIPLPLQLQGRTYEAHQGSITSKETEPKKCVSTYSSEIKLTEGPDSLTTEIKDDIQEDETNIGNNDLPAESPLSQCSGDDDHATESESKHNVQMKKYVEDFCKTIESVDEETVSDSIRSQASDQGTTSAMYKRQSIVTFADLLKLPDREKDTCHSGRGKIVKPQSRAKFNIKYKRTRIGSESRRSSHSKSKGTDCRTEGFGLQTAEGSSKGKRRNASQCWDGKKIQINHPPKVRGVYVRSLYVNSTQEIDNSITRRVSSIAESINKSKFIFKSQGFRSTPHLDEEEQSSDDAKDISVKPEPLVKDSSPEDNGPTCSAHKPKKPIIRTITQKRRGTVLSPKKKRRRIEIVLPKDDDSLSEYKGIGTIKTDENSQITIAEREDATGETVNCPALTKENIKKMLASLNQANTVDLKASEDVEDSKDKIKEASAETKEINEDKEDKVKESNEERLSVDLEAPPINSASSVCSEKEKMCEVPVPVCEKNESALNRKDDKKIQEKFIELFGESPMPTPKRRKSDNDEMENTFEQLEATDKNKKSEFDAQAEELEGKIIEFAVQTKLEDEMKEFEKQSKDHSVDLNETDNNISWVDPEVMVCKSPENSDISKTGEPSSKAEKCTDSGLAQPVVEIEKQEPIQSSFEEDKENLSHSKEKISCLADISFDESNNLSSKLNNSGSDLKNISTSAADYRIEAVSTDVVNVFITRKRRKRKP